jgi:hypothetical protein
MNNYLEQLFNVEVGNLKLVHESNDRWQYLAGVLKPRRLQGRTMTRIEFETNAELDKKEYGSIRIVGLSKIDISLFSYSCLCFPGTETNMLLKNL